MGPSRLFNPTYFPSSQCPFLNCCQWNNPEWDGGKYWFRATIVNPDVSWHGCIALLTEQMLFRWSFEAAKTWRCYTGTYKQTEIRWLCFLLAVSIFFLPVVLRQRIPPYSKPTDGEEASRLLAWNTIPLHQTTCQGRLLTIDNTTTCCPLIFLHRDSKIRANCNDLVMQANNSLFEYERLEPHDKSYDIYMLIYSRHCVCRKVNRLTIINKTHCQESLLVRYQSIKGYQLFYLLLDSFRLHCLGAYIIYHYHWLTIDWYPTSPWQTKVRL